MDARSARAESGALPAGSRPLVVERKASRLVRVMLLVLAIGLVPLSIGDALVRQSAASHEREELDASLTSTVSAQTAALSNYFERARSIILLTGQNPAFHDFYAAPGSRLAKVRGDDPLHGEVNDALLYLEQLYPTSIGEACFIDHGGPEIARVVNGAVAPPENLSPDESGNPFFAPTFKRSPGEVYQARPYVSPDTQEWVISNSTPIPLFHGRKAAIVHFEVTIESFRRTAALTSRFPLAVIDAGTGRVIFDSRYQQKLGAPLGRQQDRRFVGLAGRNGSGILTVSGARAAYRQVPTQAGNMNRWLVVASAPPVRVSLLRGNAWPLLLLTAALLVIAYGVARRWVRVRSELDESQGDLRASEQQYRMLFEEAEDARQTLAVQNDQLRELDRLKDEFVALVSHELRTPLTSISGYLDLITEQADELSAEQNEFLGVVQRNAARLTRLVGDLLFVAQVDAGGFRLEKAEVDLVELARDCHESGRLVAEEKGIDFVLSADPVHYFDGDPARLGQLLDNLVSNALKFTPEGGRVTLRVAGKGDRAIIRVADSGAGIPVDEQPHLFDRFYRSSSATASAVPGTGLGLAIAKAIVDAHGGTITVMSRENVGTTFEVELPLDSANVVTARSAV
jgi:signal transduction histidine kinase